MSAADPFTPAAFDCRECGRSMLVLTSPEPPPRRVCGFCTVVPGWFRNPELRALLEHGPGGTAPADRSRLS